MFSEKCVAIVRAPAAAYPRQAPFHPAEAYPEYRFAARATERNSVYAAVRELFRLLELDHEHYGTRVWNPLGSLIKRGDLVVLKPNFVMDRHYTGGDYDSVVTHGAVIRAVLDYVALALQGTGRMVIADAPMIDNDFDQILARTGVAVIADYYARQGLRVEVLDLRVENVEMRDGLIVRRFKLAGDPAGYIPINLGQESEFADVAHLHRRLRGSDYDSRETAQHHNENVNEYLLSRTVLAAQVFINLPKLKTHKKIGVTLNLKNLIGINGDKNWIPHYRVGGPDNDGDEYEMANALRHMESLVKDRFKEQAFRFAQSGSSAALYVARKLRSLQKRMVAATGFTRIRAGGWHGNDTIWRAVLDLNKILRFADAEGRLQATPQRRCFSVMDGIIGGEGDGPLLTSAKPAGVLLAGENPLAVDLCATHVMGFDFHRITQFRRALALQRHPLMAWPVDEIECRSNVPAWRQLLHTTEDLLHFQAATGWEGKIELVRDEAGL